MATALEELEQPLGVNGSGTISPVNWFSSQGYPVRSTTRVTPLVGGEEAFDALRTALRGASVSINMAFWGLDPGFLLRRGTRTNYDVTEVLGELLLAKAASGVKVRVVVWDQYTVGIGSGSGGQADLLNQDTGGNNTNLAALFELAKTTPNLEVKMTNAHSATPALGSFHQKIVVTDVEVGARATAFVMGHNFLVPYWSTQALVPSNPRRDFVLRNVGPSFTEYDEQNVRMREVLSQYPTLPGGHLGRNLRDMQERLTARTDARSHSAQGVFSYVAEPAPQLKPYLDISTRIRGAGVADVYHNFARVWRLNGGTPSPAQASPASFGGGDTNENTMAQLAATFKNPRETAIEDLYFNAIRNANKYVLMVNQYFRYWDLTERIIDAWAERGIPTDKEVPIYCITNDFNDSTTQGGHDGETQKLFADAGIKVSLCKMKTKENIGRKSIYVHAKLLVVDDVFYTIGSANYNYRSLQGDPEMNVGVVDFTQTENLRREVMNILIESGHNGMDALGDARMQAFAEWEQKVAVNSQDYANGARLTYGRCVQYTPHRWNIPGTNSIVQNDDPSQPNAVA